VPGSEGEKGSDSEGGGQGGEMTQTMYAHMNKWIILKERAFEKESVIIR
jgi:hypothetical protein